jgi:hypothetical protein
MPDLVRGHVSLRELAERAEALLQFVIERQIGADLGAS